MNDKVQKLLDRKASDPVPRNKIWNAIVTKNELEDLLQAIKFIYSNVRGTVRNGSEGFTLDSKMDSGMR